METCEANPSLSATKGRRSGFGVEKLDLNLKKDIYI